RSVGASEAAATAAYAVTVDAAETTRKRRRIRRLGIRHPLYQLIPWAHEFRLEIKPPPGIVTSRPVLETSSTTEMIGDATAASRGVKSTSCATRARNATAIRCKRRPVPQR